MTMRFPWLGCALGAALWAALLLVVGCGEEPASPETAGFHLDGTAFGRLPYCDEIEPLPVHEFTDADGNRVTVQNGQPCRLREPTE